MYKIPISKKADSRLLSPWLFLIMGIIGIGIFLGVWNFYSVSVDVRSEEASILANKLYLGLSENGILKESVFEDNFNLIREAGLEENKFELNGKFYFNVSIFENGILKKSFFRGNSNFEVNCFLNGQNLGVCVQKKFIILDGENNKYEIKILSGSNQIGSKL